MIHRRDFIIMLGAAGALAACQSTPSPTVANVNLRGTAGMNPGPGGGDRPVTVLLMRLRGVGSFNSADYFALQANPQGAVGGDFVGMDQVVLSPGGSASRTINFEADATHLGIVALVREPGGRNWRRAIPIRKEATSNVNGSLGSGGLTVAG